MVANNDLTLMAMAVVNVNKNLDGRLQKVEKGTSGGGDDSGGGTTTGQLASGTEVWSGLINSDATITLDSKVKTDFSNVTSGLSFHLPPRLVGQTSNPTDDSKPTIYIDSSAIKFKQPFLIPYTLLKSGGSMEYDFDPEGTQSIVFYDAATGGTKRSGTIDSNIQYSAGSIKLSVSDNQLKFSFTRFTTAYDSGSLYQVKSSFTISSITVN